MSESEKVDIALLKDKVVDLEVKITEKFKERDNQMQELSAKIGDLKDVTYDVKRLLTGVMGTEGLVTRVVNLEVKADKKNLQ